jgi:hypothetical protein
LARIQEKRTFIDFWWECKLIQPPWNAPKKLNMDLPYVPAMLLLRIFPKE